METSLDAPVTADAEDGDERTLDVADKHPDIEQHLVEEARKAMIKHAINKLPEKQKARCCCTSIRSWITERSQRFCLVRRARLKSLLFRAYEDAASGVGAAGFRSENRTGQECKGLRVLEQKDGNHEFVDEWKSRCCLMWMGD